MDKLREALEAAHHFLSHTGNHRALVGNNFSTPSIRYNELKRVTKLLEAALRQQTLGLDVTRVRIPLERLERMGGLIQAQEDLLEEAHLALSSLASQPDTPPTPREGPDMNKLELISKAAVEITDEFCGGSEAVFDVVLAKLSELVRAAGQTSGDVPPVDARLRSYTVRSCSCCETLGNWEIFCGDRPTTYSCADKVAIETVCELLNNELRAALGQTSTAPDGAQDSEAAFGREGEK